MPGNPLKSTWTARLIAGAALLALPSALTLFAGDPPPKPVATAPAPATTTSRPATMTAAEIKEAKKQEEIARVMAFFEATQPDVFAQATALRDTDPQRFEKLVQPAIGTVNRLENLKKKNPALFDLTMQDLQLDYQTLRLARQLKDTKLPPADRDKITADLNAKVAEEFGVRQQIRQKEIEDLQAQLKDLETKLQNNESIKDSLIKKRVEELEKNPRLDW